MGFSVYVYYLVVLGFRLGIVFGMGILFNALRGIWIYIVIVLKICLFKMHRGFWIT